MGIKDWVSKGAKPAAAGEAHPFESEAGIHELQQALAGSQPSAEFEKQPG